ncbi:hypothetical protein [Parachlamydia sp. AcF125]|uniref:hypothetical protein n=1 Tax=Parachlamydia sp. AcF125 TaxID=2795736 RepID=UPI001BCA1BFF|nr:hypothetical protein [Parachlamydia sp. AcF125]
MTQTKTVIQPIKINTENHSWIRNFAEIEEDFFEEGDEIEIITITHRPARISRRLYKQEIA